MLKKGNENKKKSVWGGWKYTLLLQFVQSLKISAHTRGENQLNLWRKHDNTLVKIVDEQFPVKLSLVPWKKWRDQLKVYRTNDFCRHFARQFGQRLAEATPNRTTDTWWRKPAEMVCNKDFNPKIVKRWGKKRECLKCSNAGPIGLLKGIVASENAQSSKNFWLSERAKSHVDVSCESAHYLACEILVGTWVRPSTWIDQV